MTSSVPLIVTVWEIIVNIWMRHEMFLISWFPILHMQFSPNPNLSQEIVISQVCHGTIPVFRDDIYTHLFQKKSKQVGGVEDLEFPGVLKRKKNCGNSSGQLKKKWNFQGCSRKTHVKFPWVLIFDLGISKECHTILQNFQGWKLFFSGICKGAVTNLKISGWEGRGGSEKYVFNSPTPVWILFWNSSFCLTKRLYP